MTTSFAIDRSHTDRVLAKLQQQERRCPLAEVVAFCPELTADQVFLAIDYLTRTGQVHLTLDGDQTYWVKA